MPNASKSELFRKLPSNDELLRQPAIQALVEREGRASVAESVRVVLANLRQKISENQLDDKALDLALGGLFAAIERQLRKSLSFSLVPLINATGVILHTNLGRAPLPHTAIDHMGSVASGYSNLEFNLVTGERGKRDVHVDRLFQKLLSDDITSGSVRNNDKRTGESPLQVEQSSAATSTIVVNNNAA